MENQAKEAKSARVAEEREKILHWVSAAEPEQKHHDVRIQRMDGTGEWLLQDKKFQRWRDEPGSSNNVLWCHGIQGSGKVRFLAGIPLSNINHASGFCTRW